MIDLVLATPELRDEPALVASAAINGVRLLRRCVDAVDLLAAASMDTSVPVVISAGLPRLSADVVSRLGLDRRIVGVARDPLDATMLDGFGVRTVIVADASTDAMWHAIRDAVLGGSPPGVTAVAPSGVWPTGVWVEPEPEPAPAARADGIVIAVWGPMGAPGRTTVAMVLSELLCVGDRRVCLVDADTYAPSISLALGLVDESGGIVRACRQADNGLLDGGGVIASTRRIRGSWHVLTGLPRVDRWPELTPTALDRVWSSLRAAFDVTVIDVGFCVEDDDAPAAWARRRNGAALSALVTADHAIAVADSTAAGAARLVAAWPDFCASVATASVAIVRNRVARRHAVGWTDALLEFGIAARVHPVPSDVKAVEACWARGRSLGEGARRSPMRKSLDGLARELMSI